MRSESAVRLPKKFLLSLGVATALFAACGEKKETPTGDAGSKTKSPKNDDDDDDDDDGGTGTSTGTGSKGGEGSITETGSSTVNGYDVCADAKKNAKVAASPVFSKICGGLAALRSAAYTGGTPTVNPTVGGTGQRVDVDSAAASVVEAKPADYFKMLKMQINNFAGFKAKFDGDKNASVTDSTGGEEPTYHYSNDDTVAGGAVSYDAKSSFIVLKDGVSYAQVTEQINANKAETHERMSSLKGLVIIEKKDDTHSYVYTATQQTYDEPKDGDVAKLKSRIKESLKNEQKYAYDNAKNAAANAK